MRRPGFVPTADDVVFRSGVQHAMHTVLATVASFKSSRKSWNADQLRISRQRETELKP
jgi:hypothetical protein